MAIIVHDWGELLTAVGTNNASIELANDIQAPAESTNLDISKVALLDGKGYSIIGLTCESGYCIKQLYTTKTIQNISFKNIYMNGGEVFLYSEPDATDWIFYLNNISFSGIFSTGVIVNARNGIRTYSLRFNNIAVNIETSNPDFQIMSTAYSGAWATGDMDNINAKVKYLGCSPSNPLIVKNNNGKVLKNSLLNIEIPSSGAKLDVGATLNNCCIIGKGSGVIIDSANGVNVVENTIPPETSLSNVYSLTTAQMKNAQYLHDLGFPIGVD